VYTAPSPQHTEAQFKVPDWGDKVDFTALLLFLALFHSIFSLLFHSIFGAVSQNLLLLFQIINGTVSSFIPGRVTVQFFSRPFSNFIPSCVTVQLWRSRKLSVT
jgi:hypothetical protein